MEPLVIELPTSPPLQSLTSPSYNSFSGVLPLSFGKLSKLKLIVFDSNNLEGPFPPSLMNCTKLVELRMQANNLEGDISTLNFSKLMTNLVNLI